MASIRNDNDLGSDDGRSCHTGKDLKLVIKPVVGFRGCCFSRLKDVFGVVAPPG